MYLFLLTNISQEIRVCCYWPISHRRYAFAVTDQYLSGDMIFAATDQYQFHILTGDTHLPLLTNISQEIWYLLLLTNISFTQEIRFCCNWPISHRKQTFLLMTNILQDIRICCYRPIYHRRYGICCYWPTSHTRDTYLLHWPISHRICCYWVKLTNIPQEISICCY